MEILNQLENKISVAVRKISELQSRLKELETKNQKYKDMLSRLESFDSTLGAVISNDNMTESTITETEPSSGEESRSDSAGDSSNFSYSHNSSDFVNEI